MFIRDVVMDGFKCYSERTVIRNLDRNFSAITGLNGSGKSNIIDAIVFAFDLSTMRVMRVATLKELINVHRRDCKVVLILDNSDRASAPAGYEDYGVIELERALDHEGRSRFRINGHNCTRSTVEKLRRSAGISLDFVVLQGHITKVLNMRGTELRGMIEEVAGTRGYNEEQVRAKLELERKETKLREAREYLKKSISPYLEEVMKEKKIYEENRDFEVKKQQIKEELENSEKLKYEHERSACIREVEGALSEYIESKAELNEIEERLGEIHKSDVGIDHVEIKSMIDEERLKLEDLRNKADPGPLEEMKRERRKLESIGKLVHNKKELLEKERILTREVCETQAIERLEELEKAKNIYNRVEIELNHIKQAVLELANKGCCAPSASVKVKTWLNGDLSNSAEAIDELERILTASKDNAALSRSLEENAQRLKARLNYVPQEGVYGTVDENFELKDSKFQEAINIILGGRSKFIICENENIAASLLQKSDRKISCIPLTKITVFNRNPIPGAGVHAIDAIQYDPRYEKAFKHIFNNIYIFEDKKEAARCCFANKVLCVTVDGTVYDPKGTLTGGRSTARQEVYRAADLKAMEERAAKAARSVLRAPDASYLQIALTDIKKYNEAIVSQRAATEKIRLLERLCNAKVDVRKELADLRQQIVEAAREEKMLMETDTEKARLDKEIAAREDMLAKSRQQAQISETRLASLLEQLQASEIEGTERKMSIQVAEALEGRKRNVIKAIVKLENKIRKLNDRVQTYKKDCDLGVQEDKENRRNKPEQESYPSAAVDAFSFFSIDPRIFTLPVSRLSKNEAAALELRIDNLRVKINARRTRTTMDPASFELLEKNIATIRDLEQKIERLEVDKAAIIRGIQTLSTLGSRENERAFEHINKNLKKFLNYFIKDADISITSDYEIRVKTGTWKNSLTELSGGQRSLIALCLIFSMLSYRPAPFYIFDEIDAALDLNYTQGIGLIIQQEFKNAQFIIVSLKNTMYEHANKVYRVFMQDQKSKVAVLK